VCFYFLCIFFVINYLEWKMIELLIDMMEIMKDKKDEKRLVNPFAGGDSETADLVSEHAKEMIENPNYWSEKAKKLKALEN
jgi:hypothetical protein